MSIIRKAPRVKGVRLTGKRILVNPVSRWNPAVMAAIKELGHPVEESEYMPVGRLYVLDPEKIVGPEVDVPLDELISVEGDGINPPRRASSGYATETFDEATARGRFAF